MRVLGERLNGIQEVKSSILSVSTRKIRKTMCPTDFIFAYCLTITIPYVKIRANWL